VVNHALHLILRVSQRTQCGEILGGIKWGFTVADNADSEIELTMAGDISDTPSKDWYAAVGKWNEVAARFGWHTFEPE